MNEYYLFISSEDSKDLYPNNNWFDFTVELPQDLNVLGKWEVAILDIFLSGPVRSSMNLCSDLCVESYSQGSFSPVLRNIPQSSKGYISYPIGFYFELIRNNIKRFRIYMQSPKPKDSLRPETLKCTLHLRRVE